MQCFVAPERLKTMAADSSPHPPLASVLSVLLHPASLSWLISVHARQFQDASRPPEDAPHCGFIIFWIVHKPVGSLLF